MKNIYLGNTSDESHLIKVEDLGHQKLKTEESLLLKLAKKNPANKHSKEDVQLLYEVMAPHSTIPKDDDVTYTIKEPGRMHVTVRKSDMA